MAKYKTASKVTWKWAGRVIKGEVQEVFLESVTRTIKDVRTTRHGNAKNPAYLIKSSAGALALKLESELQTPNNRPGKKSSKKHPKIFGA